MIEASKKDTSRSARSAGAVAALAAAVALLTACGAFAGDTHRCTLIDSPAGLRVDIAPELAKKAVGARLTACWDDTCHQRILRLREATSPGDPTMTTESPAAGGPSIETERPAEPAGWPDFALVPGLPTKPVRVTLVLTDQSGVTLVDRQTTLTPKPTHPNGPRCSPGGPQAALAVAEDGSLLPR
ncbi:hypothetical protein ACFV9D_09605 [Streptomyces sp. NPDC059875]|uniref:hypothetical protein n=1 Tax=unclassified Streptomyces TaxID=2593676 RepID=UPI00364BF47A